MQPRLTRILATVALAVALLGQNAQGWYPYGRRYTQWQKTRPLLFGAVHNAVPRDRLPERIARFKAAGLNMLMTIKPPKGEHFHKAADEAGLAWATWHPERFASATWKINNPGTPLDGADGKKLFTHVLRTPGCAFVQVSDGPKEEKHLDDIAAFSQWLRRTYPDILVFASLSIAKIDHDLFVKKTRPDVFSYYKYPLYQGGEADMREFLWHMKWARDSARKHRLPFWMYLQAWGVTTPSGNERLRHPHEADLRYVVFTFLAHGGNGAMMFLYYGMHEPMVVDTVIDEARTPSKRHRYENTVTRPAWHAVRDVAPEVQTLARALLNLRTKDPIGYTGKTPVRCKRFKGHGRLRAVANRDNAKESALVAFFDDQAEQEYFMVVNLKHGEKMSKTDGLQTLRLTFTDGVQKIERLNRLTGRVETLKTKAEGSRRILDVRLEGGTGDLFKWSNGKPWALR